MGLPSENPYDEKSVTQKKLIKRLNILFQQTSLPDRKAAIIRAITLLT
jgi:hypothetical protein